MAHKTIVSKIWLDERIKFIPEEKVMIDNTVVKEKNLFKLLETLILNLSWEHLSRYLKSF